MPYTPQTWSDLPSQTTPITAARLSHIETQYDAVAADIDDPATPVGAAVAAQPVSTATQAALDLKQDESTMDASVAAQVESGPLTGAALDAGYARIDKFAVQSSVPNLDNTAGGLDAMQFVDGTVGRGAYSSTAFGANALSAFTGGHSSTAFGANALENATTAAQNTGIGMNALRAVTTGNNNTAVGKSNSEAITTGSDNTGIGYANFHDMTTGSRNTAIGVYAGYTDGTTAFPDGLTNATMIGFQSITKVSNSVTLGGLGANRVNVNIGTHGEGGNGLGVIHLREKVTAPTTLPATTGALYVDGGALKYMGSSGTVTVVAPA